MKLSHIFFLSICLISENAYAYLDPGTGSMLVYFLLGIFATIAYAGKELVYKIKIFLSSGKIDASLSKPQGVDILFYSEGGKYWNVFLPVIEALSHRKIKTAYYTLDDKDPAFNCTQLLCDVKYIGRDLQSFILMNKIEVKLVVMTTPQLDIMQLKRSKKVAHYSHLIHSPADALHYKKFAFDYFDSVLCSGQYQIDSIKALQQLRELPEKKLYKTGLTYFDMMIRHQKDISSDSPNRTILVAPTWGENSMLVKFGSAPIVALLEKGFEIIFRPHPQSFISQKDLMDKILQELSTFPQMRLDKSSSPEKAMQQSTLLISDVSGIIFDYYFIYKKPVVLIEGKIKREGFEAEDVDREIWEIEIVKEFATIIKKYEKDNFIKTVDSALAEFDVEDAEKLAHQHVFNFGRAGEKAAEQICEILSQLDHKKV